MAITSGADILASTWNTHVRAFTKKTVFTKTIKDKILQDNSASGNGTFWCRSAGWNWPQFLALHKTGETYILNEEVALYITPVATEYIIAVRCNNAGGTSATPDPAHADWDLYRFEHGYSATKAIVIGDEVVHGGGLFTAITNAGTTAPILPKYADLANSDTNYTRSSTNNTTVSLSSGGFSMTLHIELKRPGVGANIRVFTEAISTSETDSETIWLSPGEYYYDWAFVDQIGLGTGSMSILTQVYDDNVKQWAELRAFETDLSDHASKGGTELLASAMNTTPLATDFDIDKKGGDATTYTGDW